MFGWLRFSNSGMQVLARHIASNHPQEKPGDALPGVSIQLSDVLSEQVMQHDTCHKLSSNRHNMQTSRVLLFIKLRSLR